MQGMIVSGIGGAVTARTKGAIAQEYIYDPETFEILTQPGQRIPSTKVQLLRQLRLYDLAVGESPKMITLPLPSGFEPQAWGKKKRAIACVRLTARKGRFHINGEPLETYFPAEERREKALQPFKKQELDPGAFTVEAYVTGGSREEGKRQPRAVAHAIAGALTVLDDSRRLSLIRGGFRLQVDPPKWVKEDGS